MDILSKLKSLLISKLFLRSLLALGIIYVVVIGITMYYLDVYTNHGQQIAVPNLKGKNIKSIQPLMSELELHYEILDSIYDPELAPGTIVDQDPKPSSVSNVFVKEGRTIRIRVSKKSRLVEVPMCIDKSHRYAESVLENSGFKVRVSYRNSSEADGAVLDQKINGETVKPGMKVPIGSTVALVVGRNEGGVPVPLPNLIGLTITEAQARLDEYGSLTLFAVCGSCATKQDSIAARVVYQNPPFAEGQTIMSGSTITVNASLDGGFE